MTDEQIHTILHYLRNPWGHTEKGLRKARLDAADLIEELHGFYVDWMKYIEVHHIDVTVKKGKFIKDE